MLQRLQQLLASPRIAWAAVLAACLLCAPSLSLGLIGDDLPHRKFVLSHLDGSDRESAWWDMFDVCGRRGPLDVPLRMFVGTLPWWTSPGLSIAFLRPLSVASHYLDYALWPNAPWLMHAQNLAWYALIVLLAGTLYRRLLGSGAAAGLATVLYAIDEAHVDGASWIAGRNTLLTAAFSLLALLAFDRWRRDGSRLAGFLHPVAMLLALASSEGALGVFGYLIAYAALLDPQPLGRRLGALVPASLVTAGWLGLAGAFGYGVRGSGLYVDPRADPLAFSSITAQRFPDVLRAQFAVPVELVRALPASAQTACAIFGTAVLLLLLFAALPLVQQRPATRFLALGLVLSAIPICAGGAEPRLLFLVGLGAHGLVGECVVACFRTLGTTALVRGARASLLALLLLLHVPVALAGGPLSFLMWSAFDAELRAATASLPSGTALSQSAILVLNTNDYLVNMFVAMYRLAAKTPGPALMHVLGASSTPVRLSRPERNALVLEPQGGYLLEHSSRLVRSPRERFEPGRVVQLLGLGVRVEATTPDGRPARVRLELLDAEDPRALWVRWNPRAQRFERVRLPAIGQSIWL